MNTHQSQAYSFSLKYSLPRPTDQLQVQPEEQRLFKPEDFQRRDWITWIIFQTRVAKQEIPAHIPLMVSKVFRVMYENDVPFEPDFESELNTFLPQKNYIRSETWARTLSTYAGPNYPSENKLEVQEALSVNADRIEDITRYNVFNPDDDVWNILKPTEEESAKSGYFVRLIK